jgi:hypothetical protein
MVRLDATTLAKLKAKGLPRLKPLDLFAVEKKTESYEVELAAAETYCAQFLPYSRECCLCGRRLGSWAGTFTWGIARGEGYCGECGYPARAIHKVEHIGTLSGVILQYHPDELEARQ